MLDVRERKGQLNKRMRMLNRVVLGGVALFLPIYIGVKLTSGSADKIEYLILFLLNLFYHHRQHRM